MSLLIAMEGIYFVFNSVVETVESSRRVFLVRFTFLHPSYRNVSLSPRSVLLLGGMRNLLCKGRDP